MATKKQLSWQSRLKRTYVNLLKTRHFARTYLIVSCAVLGLTTLLWTFLSATIHLANADQLINAYLLESPDTFANATFPDQHSFLLKIPFFLLIRVLGGGSASYLFVTVLVVLLSVGLLAFILSRIERRPVVLGTLFLALSLSLLLVPTQPHNGSLLPLNMGMVTTRNIEYIIFIAGLYCIIRMSNFKSRATVAAIALLTLLFASDKLFVPLSLGGAGMLLVVSFIVRRRDLVKVALHWLAVTIISVALSTGTLLLLNSIHLFHTTGAAVGPYGLIHTAKDFAIGSFYSITNIFTNFGANPVADILVIKDIPHALVTRAISPATISFLVTIALSLAILWSMYRLATASLRPQPSTTGKPIKLDTGFLLAIMLLWASVTAVGIFIFTQHYYPVDGRYEAIVLFAGFICLAQYLRHLRPTRQSVVTAGIVLIGGILLAIPFVIGSFANSQQAGNDLKNRNDLIAKNLAIHHVDTLVGDYWRVLPIKLQTANTQKVVPMAGCTTPRGGLSSSSWRTDFTKHSFAYIVTFDGSTTGYPVCLLTEIVGTYGRPNQTVVIKGSITEPKELLLFYDHGAVPPIKNPTPQQQSRQLNTIQPIALDELPQPSCSQKTIMNFVAHEDDDILFMNPDLIHDIDAGNCIRTVYLTAGDSGSNELYWLGRQKGSEAAYDTMLGKPNQVWNERTLILPDGQFATIANPQKNRSISLIFMHIPDGNLTGNGFAATNYQSLQKLREDKINEITTIDHHSAYNSTQLTNSLEKLMELYRPESIRSQSSYDQGRYGDHPDHTSVAHFATEAHASYLQATSLDSPITYYLGYPVHAMPPNVSESDLDRKAAAFLVFGRYDAAVCHSMQECDTRAVYGMYLRRQYTNPN